jgi:hypothetical protein
MQEFKGNKNKTTIIKLILFPWIMTNTETNSEFAAVNILFQSLNKQAILHNIKAVKEKQDITQTENQRISNHIQSA